MADGVDLRPLPLKQREAALHWATARANNSLWITPNAHRWLARGVHI
jgi:hypothetical protein